MIEASSPAADRPQRVNKRVARACDYCRKKRLKCTQNQRPCLNCQLYNAQCTWRGREPRRTPPKNSTQHRKREEAAEVVASVDAAATADLTQSQREGVSGPSIDPALELAVNPLTDPFNGFVTGPGELHWTRGPEYEACNSSPDFDNALHELGIGMSAPLWGLEGAPTLNTPEVQPSFIGTNYDQVGCSGDQGIYGNVGRREASSSVSFSHSSISEPDTASGKVAGIQSLTRKEAIGTEAQASIPPGVLVRKNEVCTNLIGLTSVGATMALCFNDAFRNQNSQLGPATVDFLIRAHNYVDEVGLASALGQSMHQLPPRDKAIQMIEEYLKNINSFYPITDKESLLRLTERLYGPDRGHVGSLDHSFFYLVVSLGALSVGHKSQSSDALDDLYEIMFQRAWSMIHDCIASPCETSLQILLLYVVHHMYMIKDGIAWVLCGFAMRIAQSIGLHREFPEDMDLPEHQIRLRSRLWMIVFSVDAKLSLSQGRSPGLEEGATDKSITPAKVRVELESAPFPDASTINCWTYTLSKIQNRFCNIMHSKNHTVSRLKAIAKVDEDLMAWRDAIPATCRPNQPILVPPESYTKVLLLHLDYMNLSRSVHWAIATLTATQAGEIPNLGLRIKACETLCLDAARSFIRALNDSASCLGDRNVFIFSVQLNNYMAAISVLYRSICHSPSSMTARADLEYLRTGKLHMELDMPRIHKTYASNSVKTLLNDILASAENLVRDNGN